MAKYLFVNRFFYPDTSATSQLLSDLAFSLAANGDEVTVVAGRGHYCSSAQPLASHDTVQGVTVQRIWASRFGRQTLLGRAIDYATFYLSAFIKLLWIMRSDQVVVAKTDPPMISVVVAIAAWLRGATLVNWLQDLFPEVGVRLGVPGLVNVQSLLVALRDRSLHAASLNVVLGERMRDALMARGIPAARILVLPNWAEKNLHPVAREQNALRNEWGYTVDEFVVGYSGNMGRAHDIESIIAAAVRLREHARIRFLFIGEGAKRRLVEQAIVANDLHNVLVKGYQDQCTLSQSLSLPDVHLVSLLPELEGLIVPSKLYGALAVGRAVINIGDTDGEVARVLHASAAGHSCASGDVQRLCELLQDVSEGDACADAGANGLRYARANLHRDIALQRWHRALAMLDIHRGGHPGRVLVGVGAAAGNGSPRLTSSMPQ